MSDDLILIGSIVVMFVITIIFGCLCHIITDKSMSANTQDIVIILALAWILACIIGGIFLSAYITLDKRIESFIGKGDYYNDFTEPYKAESEGV